MTQPQNTHAKELEYYQQRAALWWDADGPFWPLHKLNTLRVMWIREQLASHLPHVKSADDLKGLKVLDIGCGGGILSESMAKLRASVTGIDVVDDNIKTAQAHADDSKLNITYRTITAEDLAKTGAAFDVVLNMEVVEHVPDPAALIQTCAGMVKPGGALFVATINRTLLSLITAKFGAEYVLGWLPKGTHDWRWFVTPEETKAAMQKSDLEIADQSGVHVNPLTKKFSLQKSMAVNYMIMATKAE